MQHAVALREWRGSVHLCAIAVSDLSASRAHLVKRPGDWERFGHPADPDPATEAEGASHATAEETTNRVCGQAIASLSEDQTAAYVAGAKAMHAALG
jgi:hypothetical protein